MTGVQTCALPISLDSQDVVCQQGAELARLREVLRRTEAELDERVIVGLPSSFISQGILKEQLLYPTLPLCRV